MSKGGFVEESLLLWGGGGSVPIQKLGNIFILRYFFYTYCQTLDVFINTPEKPNGLKNRPL